jgi:hypothetical protein
VGAETAEARGEANMDGMRDKVALITVAASGVGRASALPFAAAGCPCHGIRCQCWER